MLRVLVLDGDDEYRNALCAHLVSAEMIACGIRSGAALGDALRQGPFDVVLCNVDLPGESGLSVATRLRLVSSAGLILLAVSARREDLVTALSLGADHYLVRPDDFRELELTIRNLHRGLQGRAVPLRAGPAPGGAWVFDAMRWTLVAPEGHTVSVTLAEHAVLNNLLTRVGEVVTRTELLATLVHAAVGAGGRNVDMIISRLRRKVGRISNQRLPIISARGIGYVFAGKGQMLGDRAKS